MSSAGAVIVRRVAGWGRARYSELMRELGSSIALAVRHNLTLAPTSMPSTNAHNRLTELAILQAPGKPQGHATGPALEAGSAGCKRALAVPCPGHCKWKPCWQCHTFAVDGEDWSTPDFWPISSRLNAISRHELLLSALSHGLATFRY